MTIVTPTGELADARVEKEAGRPVIAHGSGGNFVTFNPYTAFVRGVRLIDANLAELEDLVAGGFVSMPGVRAMLDAAGRVETPEPVDSQPCDVQRVRTRTS